MLSQKGSKSINHEVFWPTILAVIIVSALIVINPAASKKVVGFLFSFFTGQLGTIYLWFVFGCLITTLYITFSKYGKIKLGKKADKPDFSTFTWLGMIFTANTGAGLCYWAVIEWAYYMKSPPYGAVPSSWQASEWAAAYGLFHWGFTIWTTYALCAVAIGYLYHVKKKPILKVSEALRTVMGDKVDGWMGKAIDIFFIFALIAGATTSMGLGTPLLGAALHKTFGIAPGMTVNAIIVAIWTILVVVCVGGGLSKGIKWLSNFNIWLAIGVVTFILVAGPTWFIINTFTSGMSVLLNNIFQMHLWTDPVGKSGFPQGWTIFYWAWYITYAPSMGIYLAKISKGRTINQLLWGSIGAGTFGSWLFFSVFGNTAMNLEVSGALPVLDQLTKLGAPQTIVNIMSAVPMGNIIMPLYVLLAFIGLATAQNSIAYALAAVTTREIGENDDPAAWNIMLWALLLGVIALALMFLGGLKPLQTICVVCSLPMVAMCIALFKGFFKSVNEDFDFKSDKDKIIIDDSVYALEYIKTDKRFDQMN